MTDKEAIDNLKNYIECLMEDYGYYKDIVEFRDSVEHLEKSLQTQQAEIEKKDKESHFIQSELDEANAQIIKLKRIIDKMSGYICAKSFDDIIKRLKDDDIAYWGVEGSIKRYFERKVENGNRSRRICKNR